MGPSLISMAEGSCGRLASIADKSADAVDHFVNSDPLQCKLSLNGYLRQIAMPAPQFNPGFRLSKLDIGVLVVGTILAVVLWQETWWMGFIVAFVVCHFFLFCNIFRIARPLELIWSAV